MKYYRIHGADNNSSFYTNNKELLEYCPKCGLISNRYKAVISSIDKFVLKKKKYNFIKIYKSNSCYFFCCIDVNNLELYISSYR